MVGEDINLENIQKASTLITPFIRTTPFLKGNPQHYPISGTPDLWLKLECLQVTGSFKVRGALSKYLSLSKDHQTRPLIAASGGNHGLAVAYTGYINKLPTTIYLPQGTAAYKIKKIKEWGAKVVSIGKDIREAMNAAKNEAASEHATYIHPFADPDVIIGQGTLGLEIFNQLPEIDMLVIAIGGGGLIGGVAKAIKALNPSIKIIGVEPETYPTLYKSLQEGRVVLLDRVPTVAATLAVRETAMLNLQLAQTFVDEIVLVSEEEIKAGACWLWNEFSVAAEFSGAAALSALITGKVSFQKSQKICVIICGAGFDGIKI